MSNTEILYIVLFLISVIMSALFSSSETAFVSMQKVRLHYLSQLKNAQSAKADFIISKPQEILTTVLLGLNFFETAVATLGTFIAISFWGQHLGVVIATIVVTIVTLIFAEVIPKHLGIRYSERIALRFITFIRTSYLIFSPVIYVLNHIGSGFQNLFGEYSETKPTMSAEEMRIAINIAKDEGVLKELESEMLQKVFRFSRRPVRQIMTPRMEATWIEKGTTIDSFLKIYAEHPHTRFPVYETSPDNVVGVLSIKDIVMAQANDHINGETLIDKLIRPAYFIPATKHLGELLAEMRAHNYHLAITVGEYGGVVGIVTLEQLAEEIVGDMRDELQNKDDDLVTIDEDTYRFNPSLLIEEANEELQLDLPLGAYTTVSGFIMDHLGRIPHEGEQLKYKNIRIIVTKMDGLKITEVVISREKETHAESEKDASLLPPKSNT